MRAGRLRHRVILQEQTETVSAVTGAVSRSWTNTATVWGGVEPLSMRERMQGGQLDAVNTHRVPIRWRPGVHSQMRVLVPKEVTTLDGAIGAADTAIAVDSTAWSWGDNDFYALIGSEVVTVTSGHGTANLTVSRGTFSTTAATHTDESNIVRLAVLNVEGVNNRNEANHEIELMCSEVQDG